VCAGDASREETPHGAKRNSGLALGVTEQMPSKRLRDGEGGRAARRAKRLRREPDWQRGDTLVAIEKEVAHSGA
jgi:hypothetical protein